MRYLIAIILIFILIALAGCSSTQSEIEYRDREVLVPDIRIESCVEQTVKKECDKDIITYRDLAECYLIIQDRIDRINNIINQCNNIDKE